MSGRSVGQVSPHLSPSLACETIDDLFLGLAGLLPSIHSHEPSVSSISTVSWSPHTEVQIWKGTPARSFVSCYPPLASTCSVKVSESLGN